MRSLYGFRLAGGRCLKSPSGYDYQAYVMGLSLSRTDLNHVVREQPIFTFLVPIFFTVMGMMVDVTSSRQ